MEALTAFKLNAHDPLGALAGWNLSTPTAPCDWWGILCSDGWVSEPRLGHLQLGGQLTHLRHLSNLKQLDLGVNNLTGGIPEEIYQCSIPSSLSRRSNLAMLDLSSNNFIGVIPANLANISTLQRLNLSHDNLEGEIPVMLASRFTDPSVLAMNPKLWGEPLDQNEGKATIHLLLFLAAVYLAVLVTISLEF